MSDISDLDNQIIEKLILDTHILIWYLEGVELSEQQIELIENQRSNNQLYISAISIWEISMLINNKKIAISISLNEWLHKVQNIPSLNIIDLSIPILIESCNLPDLEHKDPADRMIIASTRAVNGYLMTLDKKILQYANEGYLKII